VIGVKDLNVLCDLIVHVERVLGGQLELYGFSRPIANTAASAISRQNDSPLVWQANDVHHGGMSLQRGEVKVRHDGPLTYCVVDVDTDTVLAGPFALHCHALGYAQSVACKRGSRVLEGVHRDLAVLASRLQEVQSRVDQLADDCRHRAGELAVASARRAGGASSRLPVR
jgi:hypothetical protein